MTDRWTVLEGDNRKVLATLPEQAAHCVITSPPYWGLRDYGHEGQIGLEETLDDHIEALVEVFRGVRRVLRDDGTLWLNYGDAYASNAGPRGVGSSDGWLRRADPVTDRPRRVQGYKPKDLLMMPARVALALQDDGWWLRSDIIWAKQNPMPESVTDRPTRAHEYVFLFAKGERYFYDAEAIKEKASSSSHPRASTKPTNGSNGVGPKAAGAGLDGPRPKHNAHFSAAITQVVPSRNKRTVWEISSQPYSEAHFATFPEALVEPCLLAGTSERGACPTCGAPLARVIGGPVRLRGRGNNKARAVSHQPDGKNQPAANVPWVPTHRPTARWEPTCDHAFDDPRACVVLDPFAGSGTVGAVAKRLHRDFVGIEINPEYAAMARRRIATSAAHTPLWRYADG